ncbi:DNA-binding protein [Salmonella enterica]|uniref:DNA-binding protein n=1 Tax=Salmonella enterica TaxID=28901 RepID=UPI0003BCB45A|nr:DNA-binding protein [Salmonella enterica]AUM42538.1 hypothetical protein SEEP1673_022895 [Salmonella enterica subsp. enterica serovar Poona str. ATCC BAA-1673]
MKQEWIAAKDLIGIGGLPSTIQGIHQKAKRDGWRKEKRVVPGVKGHQVYFYLHDLPNTIQLLFAGKTEKSPMKHGLNFGLISMLEMTSPEDQLNLFQAICEIGIKGILSKLQQPDAQHSQPEREYTTQELETMIMTLPVRESLKTAFARGITAGEDADKEILRILESHERGVSPGGDSDATENPDPSLKQKAG